MWYLKVSSSLLIAVALICMIQDAISLSIDPKATEDQWSTLESSTDQNDLKKISKLCKTALTNFNEKLENTKTISNKKLPEPNNTTEDLANLVSDIKNQVKNASADLVTVRKLVQKTALRFRDTFKSLVSFTELDNDSVNKELESIKKITVDSKKPLVNRVIRSFGNRYDLNKLANKVLVISSDREKLKNNYDKKKSIAKKEFNSLWNSLSNHSKTVNDNALKALDTFFEGMKSLKSVKKKVKTIGEDALSEIKGGDDIIKLKNAVELAKSLKLKFEDEWDLDSGELTYSEEQKKPNTKATDNEQSDVQENEGDKANEITSTNNVKPNLPITEVEPTEKYETNIIPQTQAGIEKLPIDNYQTSDKAVSPTEETQLPLEKKNKDVTKIIQPTISETEHNPIDNNVSNTIDYPIEENPSISNTENKDKPVNVQPEVSNKGQNSINDDYSKLDSSNKNTLFNPDINNNNVLTTPLKNSIDNKRGKRINKITSREKTLILPWKKLIQLDNPHVSQQSTKCENLLNDVSPDFDNIKRAAKSSIQVTKSYKNLQKIESDTVKQFYDKMVDTNTKLCDYLIDAADDVCAKVTPINKRYETKFKNDPNIKRIKYLLGKQYDPNQYILKVLDDANHKDGIGGMKKKTYYKMLAVAHNLDHETKEMEKSALYAMNKIHEGQLAATNLQKKFNKEKASKACYIRNILIENENENDKKNKDENKEKVKENINDDTNTEPLNDDVNLDSVDKIQPSTVLDDNENILNNDKDKKPLSEPNAFTNPDNQKGDAYDTHFDDSQNTKGSMEQGTQEPNNSSYTSQNKNNINTSIEENGNNKAKRNITKKITHHRKHRNPNDPNDVSEEYDTIEEIDDEDDESYENENNSEKIQNKVGKKNPNITYGPKTFKEIESLKQEGQNNLNKSGERNEENVTDDQNNDGNTSVKPRVKHPRKRIDPKDGKQISEEYETSGEEDENNLNKSPEEKSEEDPGSELLDHPDSEHDMETPEHSETKKVDSEEENVTDDQNNDGNTSVKPRVKHPRKRIDPKDGKQISEEYETSGEEDENNLNKSPEEKSEEDPGSELLDHPDSEHDMETHEHSEPEKVDSEEENVTDDQNNDGNLSVKPKVKHSRKRIDPKDGKQISEEYETSGEEDENNLNKSSEEKSKEDQGSELLDHPDSEHDMETPEHSETEKVDSDEENVTDDQNNDGNTSVKPRVKHRRKRLDPKDGKEISEEYETSGEEDDNNLNKSSEEKSEKDPGSELLDHPHSEHDMETPEHSETEKVDSDEENITDDQNNDRNTSVKPRVKHRRKRIDPKDGKEKSEEYETSGAEDDNNLNKSSEEKSEEDPGSELLEHPDSEHDMETPETEKVDSDEENVTDDQNNDGNISVKPRVKRRRKRIDPKDGNEISEEYETSRKEDENKSNEIVKNDSDEMLDPDISNNYANSPDEKEYEEENNVDEENVNDNYEDSTVPESEDNVEDLDAEHNTEETDELDENENLNSVEGAELNGVDNDNIIPAADSIGEDSSSVESSYEKKEQGYFNDSNNSQINNKQYDSDYQPKKILKGHRKRKSPKDGEEMSGEYDTAEEEDNSSMAGKKLDTPTGKLGGESSEYESETPDYEDMPENENINENDKYPDHNQSEESEVFNDNEPQLRSYEEIEKSHEIDQQNDGENLPDKKKRRRRKRKDPLHSHEISEEYDTVEEEDDNSSITGNNLDTPTGNLGGESTDHESETPDYEYMPENENNNEKDKYPDHNPFEEPEVFNENEPQIRSNEKIEKSHEIDQQNDGDNVPDKKKRRRRKRKDPVHSHEISEEYDTVEEEEDTSPVSGKNLNTPTGNLGGESTDLESETPDYEDMPENENINENDKYPDHNQSEEPEVFNENEPQLRSYEEIEKSHEIEKQNDGDNLPDKKKRRRRKRKDPLHSHEISEEYDTVKEEEDTSPVSGKNLDTPTGNLGGESTDLESETPDYEDMPENENINENDKYPDHNQSEEPEVFNENEPQLRSYEEIEKSHEIEKQNDGDNLPDKKKRRRRKRKDPLHSPEISEEYDTVEEEDDNSSMAGNNLDTPTGNLGGESTDHESETPDYEDMPENENNNEKDKYPDHNQSEDPEVFNENEPEIRSIEEIEKSLEIDQQNDGDNLPDKKKRRRRKRKDPLHSHEISEEYDTVEEEEDTSPVSGKNLDTPTGNLGGESTDLESETPDYEDMPENENINENDKYPDHNQSEEPEVFNENEPQLRSYEEIEKSHEIEKQNDGDNLPDKKKRRRRKRKDPLHSPEISEEYDTVEEEDDNSSMAGNNLDTPTGNLGGESTDHESETPDYEDMPENENNNEKDKYPDHNQSEDPEVFNENEPEIRSIEEIEKSLEIDQQNVGDNLPDKKKRRRRKRKDPLHSHEISEEYDTVEEEEDTSPVSGKNLDTPTGNLGGESTELESETPDYEDMPENENINENDKYPDHNQSEEPEVFNENEPQLRSYEEIEKSHEIEKQNDGDNLPDKKKRRRRKRKDPLHSPEISEEYDTVEEEDDNSSMAGNNLDTPTGNLGGESTDHESETPDYEDMPENENNNEKDKYPDHNQSEDPEVFNENEPEIRSIEEIEKSLEIDQQNDGDNLPDKKKRQRRKRKDPLHSHEISEEYDTVEEEEDTSPVSGKNLDTPTGNLGGESTDLESETPDYEDMPENENINENDKYPDHNQSEEPEVFNENEPQLRSYEEIEKSHEIEKQNDGDNLPDKKKRRRRKRKDPLHSPEISEEYDTVEEEDDNSSMAGNNLDTPTGNLGGESTDHESETPDYEDMPENENNNEKDKYPDHNQSEDPEVFNENEPEIRSIEEIEKSLEIDQQNDGDNLPDKKKRRRRKRKDPLHSHEISEEYDTVEEEEDTSPVSGKNLDTPTGNLGGESTDLESETTDYEDMPENENINENDKYPDHNQSEEPEVFNENEPQLRSYEEIEKSHEIEKQNDGDNLPDKKKRRRRKRKDPLHSHEISEEYDTVEEEEDTSPVSGKNLDTPTGNLGGESTDLESETPDYEDMPENENINENDKYPDHNQSEEPEVFNENEPQLRSYEEIEKSHEIEKQNDGDNLPDKKKRRRRKRKDPLHSHEISEKYDIVDEEDDNSSIGGNNLETPTENLGRESTDHESETPDYEDMPENENINENDKYPDHNQFEEPEVFNENEPQLRSYEEIEKSHEIEKQNDGDNLPDKKKRRRRKRKDPVHSHEISEEYDTVQEEEDTSPVSGKNLDTPTGNLGGESTDHESETPDYEDMPENENINENDKYPDHNQSEEPEVFNENEPQLRSYEEFEKSHEIEKQNDGDYLPDKKKRRRRKRKDPLHSHEISEEYDTVEEEDDNSSMAGNNLDTPTGNLGGESTDHESETPDYEDMPENENINENDKYPDHNQSEEPEVFNENEPQIRSNEEIEKSHEIDQQNYGDNVPDKKKRRRRKRKDPLHSHEISEEYDTVEEEDDNSSMAGNNLDTPTGNLGGESTDHESETPDYEYMPENENINENDKYPDHNQSEEPEMFNENEPQIRSNEEIQKSLEIDQQKDGDNLPDKKKRRRRKRKGPLHSHEISEEYDIVKEEDDNSSIGGNNLDTPTGYLGGESTDHESETPDYEDMPENENINENDKYPGHNQSEEPEVFNENEPQLRSYEEIEKSHEIEKQNDGDNLPDKKKRRRRKRKDPLHSHEISEEYDTVEEEDDNSSMAGNNLDTPTGNLGGESTDHESETPDYEYMPENENINENDKYPDHNQSEEPEMFNENEPQIRSNEEIQKSLEIDQQKDGDNLPDKKKRRRRKRKGPLHSHEISEEYDIVKEEDDNSSIGGNNLDTPTGNLGGESTDHESETPDYEDMPENENNNEKDKYPDHNLSEEPEVFNENEPQLRSYEEIEKSHEIEKQNDGDNLPDKKKRRRRKRKDPLHSHEISDEYDTVEEEDDNSSMAGNNLDTPTGNLGGESTDHESETPDYEDMPENENNNEKDKYPDHNLSEEPEVFNENEPQLRSYEEIEKSHEIEKQNDGDNLPDKKKRRRRKRKDPLHSHEISEEYDTVEDDNNYENVSSESSSPNDVDESGNVAKPRPRKLRRRKKSRKPKTINENYNKPDAVNGDKNVQDELPENENSETTDIDNEVEQPELSEYSENLDVAPEASNFDDESGNVAKARPRKLRRRRKSRKPKTVDENDNEPDVVNNDNIENNPVEDQERNYEPIPYEDNNIQEELTGNLNGETTDVDSDNDQPELSGYPENLDVAPEALSPNDIDESRIVAKPRPRKLRRRKKSRQPKTINENYNIPDAVNGDKNVQDELLENGNRETTDIDNEIEQPELSEYSENLDVAPEASNFDDESGNVAKPRPRKLRRRRKSRKPKTVIENDNEPDVFNDQNIENNPVEDQGVNYERIPYDDNNVQEDDKNNAGKSSHIGKKLRKKPRHISKEKIPTTVDDITPNSLDTGKRRIQNDDKSVENTGIQPNYAGRKPPKKRRLRRIRTYMINKATNERIPINDETYTTTDGLPDTPKNKLEETEREDSDDTVSNEDNDDYSSFLFKEYNSDQCKRDAYDRFKKVTSQDAKQIAYRSVLDTSEMRSNMLATIKNAIGNVKVSKTLNDVDQSLRTVSYSLKTGLKQTVSDLVTKVIPLAKDFLKTTENLKELYKNGPQSTHKMLSNILESESTVPDSAKDVLKLISPNFDVDELINNIFEKPFNTKSLKEKKAKAQRKLISLSKHMDTAISNIDCFVLSAMSAVGIGADTLKLLKSGRVIMSDKHPRAKALKDAMGIIKSGKKIRNNDIGFTPTLTPSDGFTESDEDDDDEEDPDQVAQKNEEFLKTVPDLDDNIPVPIKVPNKRQSLGVIVVHPDKQIEYKEVTDTSQLKKFVGDQTKKYKLQSKNKHPKFLKLNSKKLIDSMVADVKKKAERNGMSKKEMVEEIIKNLKSS